MSNENDNENESGNESGNENGNSALTPLWEVFIRPRGGLNHKHVGSLHAADEKLAMQAARDVYCLLYTSPSPRDLSTSRMPSSA